MQGETCIPKLSANGDLCVVVLQARLVLGLELLNLPLPTGMHPMVICLPCLLFLGA